MEKRILDSVPRLLNKLKDQCESPEQIERLRDLLIRSAVTKINVNTAFDTLDKIEELFSTSIPLYDLLVEKMVHAKVFVSHKTQTLHSMNESLANVVKIIEEENQKKRELIEGYQRLIAKYENAIIAAEKRRIECQKKLEDTIRETKEIQAKTALLKEKKVVAAQKRKEKRLAREEEEHRLRGESQRRTFEEEHRSLGPAAKKEEIRKREEVEKLNEEESQRKTEVKKAKKEEILIKAESKPSIKLPAEETTTTINGVSERNDTPRARRPVDPHYVDETNRKELSRFKRGAEARRSDEGRKKAGEEVTENLAGEKESESENESNIVDSFWDF